VKGKTVVLIDDGLATGSSMRAAISALRQMDPLKIVVAVPVASQATCEELGKVADEVICAAMPVPFLAVGQWYHEFSQTTDEEVRELLDRSAARDSSRAA
jgi:predicted phosphoribosyltransferase